GKADCVGGGGGHPCILLFLLLALLFVSSQWHRTAIDAPLDVLRQRQRAVTSPSANFTLCQPWTRMGEQSGLRTRIGATESVSLCVPMKSICETGNGGSHLRRLCLTSREILSRLGVAKRV